MEHYKLLIREEAESVASRLNKDEIASENGWTYKAVDDPKGTGYSLIYAYDEDGVMVGRL
jgi:hypothetical protein